MSVTDTLNVGAMREAAEKATPGPWARAGRSSIEPTHDCSPGHVCRGVADTSLMGPVSHAALFRAQEKADAEYIATVDPPTVLALLDALAAARAAIARVRELAELDSGDVFLKKGTKIKRVQEDRRRDLGAIVTTSMIIVDDLRAALDGEA